MGAKKVFSKAMALTLAGVVTFQGAAMAHATTKNIKLYRKNLDSSFNKMSYGATDSMTFGETSNEFYVLKHNGEKTKNVSVSYYVRDEKTKKKTCKKSYTYVDTYKNSHANSIEYKDGKLCVATCGNYVTRIDVSEEQYGRADYQVVDSKYNELTVIPNTITSKNADGVKLKVGAITHFSGKLYLIRFDGLRFALGKFEKHNGKKVFKIVSNFVKLDNNLGFGADGYQDITYDSEKEALYVASFNKDDKKSNTILKLKITYNKNNVLEMSYTSEFALNNTASNQTLYEVEGLCIQKDSGTLFFCTNEKIEEGTGKNKTEVQNDSAYLYNGNR